MPFPNTVQIPIAFTGGLNSKVSEFSLDQPNFQELQNAEFNQYGQIDKRPGFIPLSANIQGGGNITAGARITTFNNELLLLDGSQLYSWQVEQQSWISRGSIFSTENRQYRILNTKTSSQHNPDTTSANNISLYAWEDARIFPLQAAGIRYSIINNQTNTLIISDNLLYANGTRPKTITDGITFYVIYNIASAIIAYSTIPVAAPSTITSTLNIVCQDGQSQTASKASIPYDAIIFDGYQLLVAYGSSSGVKLSGYNFIIDSRTGIQSVAMCQDSLGNIWVAYSDSHNSYISCSRLETGGFVSILGPTLISPFASYASNMIGIVEGIDPGSCNITTANAGNLVGAEYITNNFTATQQGIITYIGQIRGVSLASKPFKYNNNIFITTLSSTALQATYYTHCLTQGNSFTSAEAALVSQGAYSLALNFTIVSKHSPNNGGQDRNNSLLSQADPLSDGQTFLFAGQRKGPFTSFQNAQTVNLGVAGYSTSFDTVDAFNNVSANNNLHFVGGIKKIYDGISCVEDNFNMFPENSAGFGCSVLFSTGGALSFNSLFTTSYQWLVVFEWADNYGQIQRSGPSVAITESTTGPGQSAILTGNMLHLTEKISPRSPVCISIYRTQGNGTIFFKITNDNQPIVNDPTQDTWTFTDIYSDLTIAANENLYTGSQLPNTAPPSCSLISLFQQRLTINSTEDEGVIWYSQNIFEQDQYNTLAMDWNSSFIEGINSRLGNNITAIGLLDSALAIFKDTSIFILAGDGPNALDSTGQFNDAALLVSDTGCTNQNSLVFITQTPKLPGGLLFKSAKGIYLLGRDQSLYYIGAPVEKYNNLTITSANLLAKSNQVVFTTLEGTALVYNYFFDAWTTWENLPCISACVWQDQLVLLKTDGSCQIQDNTGLIWNDTTTAGVVSPISLFMKTPWIKASGGMQGYQSVYSCMLLGTLQNSALGFANNSPSFALQVQVSYDYNPSIIQTINVNATVASNRWGALPIWGSDGIWGNPLFTNFQFQINLANPRCQAIQLSFSDINNTAFIQGFSLNGLALEVQIMPGQMRLPVGNKVG